MREVDYTVWKKIRASLIEDLFLKESNKNTPLSMLQRTNGLSYIFWSKITFVHSCLCKATLVTWVLLYDKTVRGC